MKTIYLTLALSLCACALDDDDYPIQPGGGGGFGIDVSPVFTTPDVRAVAAHDGGACALIGASVWCWGRNEHGQMGDPSIFPNPAFLPPDTTIYSTPRPVPSLQGNVLELFAGGNAICVVMNNAAPDVMRVIKCWGDKNVASAPFCAAGTCYDTATPTQIILPTTGGETGTGPIGTSFNITVGVSGACAQFEDFQHVPRRASVWCWGKNQNGQLGVGDILYHGSPTMVSNANDGIALFEAGSLGGSLGLEHGCFQGIEPSTGNTRHIMCSGNCAEGQCGPAHVLTTLNATPSIAEPALQGRGQVLGMTAGDRHTCASFSAPTEMKCWGDHRLNHTGAPGAAGFEDGTNHNGFGGASVTVHGISPRLVAGTASASHMCSSTTDGINEHTIRCWGNDQAGQLGDGTVSTAQGPTATITLEGTFQTPVVGGSVMAVGKASSYWIAGGSFQTGLGFLYAWGEGSHGELGNTLANDSATPVRVALP